MNQRMGPDRESADTVDFWWHGEELKTLQRQRPEVGQVLDDRNADPSRLFRRPQPRPPR